MRRRGRELEMREMRTGAEYHRASQREPSPGGGESAPRRAGGEWVGEAGRCKRCGAYFATRKQAKSAHCVFHKGKYASPGGGIRWYQWSCCNATDRDAEGCVTLVGEHLQCLVTTKALATFAQAQNSEGEPEEEEVQVLEAGGEVEGAPGTGREEGAEKVDMLSVDAEGLVATPHEAVREEGVAGGKEGGEEGGEFVTHIYCTGETLPGLALRYGVTVQNIKRANGISGTELDPGRRLLLIPAKISSEAHNPTGRLRGPAERVSKEASLRQKASAVGCTLTKEEARYYIMEHDDDVHAALDAALADMAWERDRCGQGVCNQGATQDEGECVVS